MEVKGGSRGGHWGTWPPPNGWQKYFYTLCIPIIDGLNDVLNLPKQLESEFKQLKSFCFWGTSSPRAPTQFQSLSKSKFTHINHLISIPTWMHVIMLSNLVLKLKCWLQICTEKAWITTFSARRLQLMEDFVPQTPYHVLHFHKLNIFQTSNIKYWFFINLGNWTWSRTIFCLKYAPKWMV